MNDMTIQEFCALHRACGDSREWAVRNCKTMQDVWRDTKPEWLIWMATRQGVLDDRTLRLFDCWSVRQVWHLLTDERSRHAVEVAERYASGCATDEELAAAMAAAWDAASAAARDAVRDAASAAAWAAAWDAASAAAMDAQAEWLRQHATPSFRKEAI